MKRLLDADIDPSPLAGKRVAIIGYGNQGRPQALNLRDSGIDVVVGLRDGSPSASRVAADGLVSQPMHDAVAGADLVMLLLPDEAMAEIEKIVRVYGLRRGIAPPEAGEAGLPEEEEGK